MNKNLNSNSTPEYKLSVAAELTNISVYSIRQYIDNGLIIPFKKESNRHLFSESDIIRLKYIQKLLVEEGMNFAGIKKLLAIIPCWAIRKCSADDRNNCQAYRSSSHPCWEASDKGTLCKNTNCRECPVYGVFENYPDVKTFINSVIQ